MVFLLELENLSECPREEVILNIDSITEKISSIYVNAADKAHMVKSVSTSKSSRLPKKQNKPWFDSSCKNKRSAYLRAKSDYRRCNSNSNLQSLKDNSKMYKNELSKCYRQFHQN